MYTKAVKYKDVWLAPGSEAYSLYEAKDWKKLDALLKETDNAKRKLEGE